MGIFNQIINLPYKFVTMGSFFVNTCLYLNTNKISDYFELIEGGAMFRLAANDRDEDILMIQYETETNNAIPRMIRWNENGYAILDQSNTSEHTGEILFFFS